MAAVAEAGGDMKSALPTVAQVLVNSRMPEPRTASGVNDCVPSKGMLISPTDPTDLTIPSRDGVDLKARCWSVPSPRGILVVAHGLGEHGGAYADLARAIGPCARLRDHRARFSRGMAAARAGAVWSADMKTSWVTCSQSSPWLDNGTPICLCSCWAIPMEVRLFSAWPWGETSGLPVSSRRIR